MTKGNSGSRKPSTFPTFRMRSQRYHQASFPTPLFWGEFTPSGRCLIVHLYSHAPGRINDASWTFTWHGPRKGIFWIHTGIFSVTVIKILSIQQFQALAFDVPRHRDDSNPWRRRYGCLLRRSAISTHMASRMLLAHGVTGPVVTALERCPERLDGRGDSHFWGIFDS